MLPDGGSAERNALWNAAESAEVRKDARTAREWIVALPSELDAEQRAALARDFGRELAARYGVAVDLAIHLPDREGDHRNHHAHVLTTTRQVSRDAAGGLVLGEKATPELSDTKRRTLGLGPAADEVRRVRELWERTANTALERAGRGERIDARSLTAQGIDREATQHLGPSASEMERHGRASDRGDGNRRVQANNVQRQQLRAQIIDLQAQREQRAVKRLEAMPLDELRRHVEATRSPGVEALMKAMPEAVERRQRAQQAKAALEKATSEIAKHSRGYAEWTAGAPVRAWLHRHGVWKDAAASKVDDWLAKQEQAKAKATADLDKLRGEAREVADRLRPVAQAEHAKLESEHSRAAPILARREEEHRIERERAEQRERVERERRQVPDKFKRMADARRIGMSEWNNDGDAWKATPPKLRQLIDRYNQAPAAVQESVLRQLTEPAKAAPVRAMMLEQAKVMRNLDRGLGLGR